jgi:hypothetical protein
MNNMNYELREEEECSEEGSCCLLCAVCILSEFGAHFVEPVLAKRAGRGVKTQRLVVCGFVCVGVFVLCFIQSRTGSWELQRATSWELGAAQAPCALFALRLPGASLEAGDWAAGCLPHSHGNHLG